MDNSGSVETVFEQEKEIAAEVVTDLEISPTTTRVAYVQFNSATETVFSFDRFATKNDVAMAIRQLRQVGGSTNTAEALKHAADDFEKNARTAVNRMVLIVTDGHSQNTIEDLTDIMRKLNDTGVTTYVATASDEPGLYEFSLFTYANGDRQFLKNNVTYLPKVISRFIAGGGCLPQDTPGLAMDIIQPPPQTKACFLDLVLILDNSESVEEVFVAEKRLAADILRTTLDKGSSLDTHVALIEFSDHARLRYSFSAFAGKDMAQLATAVENVAMVGGSTNTAEALVLCASVLQDARNEAVKLVLLITDGQSQNRLEELAEAATTIRKLGSTITIATASDDADIGFYELSLLADGHFERLFLKKNLSALLPEFEKLASSDDCAKEEVPDLLIVVDNSESVQDVFALQKEAAVTLVQSVRVGPTATRISLIQFSDNAATIFGFNQFTDETAVMTAIHAVPQAGGSTNTLAALKLAMEVFLDSNRNKNVQKVLLLLTDGQSQNSLEELDAASKNLHENQISVYVATASDQFGPVELKLFVGGNPLHVFLRSNLSSVGNKISGAISDCAAVTVVRRDAPATAAAVCQTDLMILLDNSDSVGEVFRYEKEIAAELIELLKFVGHKHTEETTTTTRVALSVFHEKAELVRGFGESLSSVSSLASTIRQLPQLGGATNTEAALRLAFDEFQSNNGHSKVNKMILLLTDGRSQNSFQNLEAARRRLGTIEVELFLATASESVDEFEFRAISLQKNDHVFLKNNVSLLPQQLAAKINSRHCSS